MKPSKMFYMLLGAGMTYGVAVMMLLNIINTKGTSIENWGGFVMMISIGSGMIYSVIKKGEKHV